MPSKGKPVGFMIKMMVCLVLIFLLLEGIPFQGGNGHGAAVFAVASDSYPVTFGETGLPSGVSWTVQVIVNHITNSNYTSSEPSIRFYEVNGSYNYVIFASTTSYTTNDASGLINISGSPEFFNITFRRTPVYEGYQPYTVINVSQVRTFDFDAQNGPSALNFGVMNTTLEFKVYNNSDLIYEKNITGLPTNFNTTSTTSSYGYVNFESDGFVKVVVTDVGGNNGYFSLELWNYFISNYSASLITLPPHFQQIFGTGAFVTGIPAYAVHNNTGMSFTVVAPYYRQPVWLAIFIFEGYYDIYTGKYWTVQVGFNDEPNGMYDVSYAGWGVFSNYASTPGGTDVNYPLVPNQTYTFSMETVSNGSWEFLVNGQPIPENGHSAFYDAPTDYANGGAYLGVETYTYFTAGSPNATTYLPSSIVIPNVESFRIDNEWVPASNISFRYGDYYWDNADTSAGMDIWGAQGNIQNKSISPDELVLDNGTDRPYDVPLGTGYEMYPVSGNFSVPFVNASRGGTFLDVAKEPNGTLFLNPIQNDTEISVVRFENYSDTIYSEYNMIISSPTYIEDPSLGFKAAICAVPINTSTSGWGYNGKFQEIALEPVLPVTSEGRNAFSLGNVSSSYSNPIYVPVYADNVSSSIAYLEQLYSFDPSLLEFSGVLPVVSSQNVSFDYRYLSAGILELTATGGFDIISSRNLLFYLVFDGTTRNQVSTEILLDSSTINGFAVGGISSSNVTLVAGWTNLGPEDINASYVIPTGGSGTATAIGYSPYDLRTLYVGSGRGGPWGGPAGTEGGSTEGFGGMYRSTDGGLSWTPIDLGLSSTAVEAIAVDPEDSNMVVIETTGLNSEVGGAIYKSVDGGNSWEETYPLGGDALYFVNGTLYAASYHAILSSHNFGTTWSVVSSFSYVVTTMAIADNGTRILVGLSPNETNPSSVEIAMSADSGSNYSVVGTFSGYSTVSQIVVDPSNASYLWALVYQGYTLSPNLFRSSDGGSDWSPVNDTAVGIKFPIYESDGIEIPQAPTGVAFDPEEGSIMYVIGPGYVFKSTDWGQHFFNLGSEYRQNLKQINRMINIDPINGSIIFIGSDNGLIVTYNGGKNWTGINNMSLNQLYDVAADGPYIFTTAASWSPLFSDDYGENWYQTQVSEEGFVAVDPYNRSIVIHVPPFNNPVEVSDNGGYTFYQSSVNESQLFVSARDSPNPISFSPRTIYIAGLAGIFYSNNSGESFQLIPNSPNDPGTGTGTVAVSPSDPDIVYASNLDGVFVSDNYGFHWREVNGLRDVVSIAVDPTNPSIIYLVVFNHYAASFIYMSSDGGVSYEYLNISSNDCWVAPSAIYSYEYMNSTFLVYVSGDGVDVSRNGGSSWINVSYNLRTLVVSSFFLSYNDSAYLSTYGMGVWYDPNVMNLTYQKDLPILFYYLPQGDTFTLDGNVVRQTGYSSVPISPGNNSISWEGREEYELASNGSIYFLNFSNMQMHLSISSRNLPPRTSFSLYAGGKDYTVQGAGTISIPLGTREIYVYPVSTDYSIYYSSQGSYSINSSLESSITIPFMERVEANYDNLTSSLSRIGWTAQVAYGMGYAVYIGAGNIYIMNTSTGLTRYIGNPFPNGMESAVCTYEDGFIIAGKFSSNRLGISYYNVSSGTFLNLSEYLPSGWGGEFLKISSIFSMKEDSFGFVGGTYGQTYFGMIDNGMFVNLTEYLPSYMAHPSRISDSFSGAYIPEDSSIMISDEDYFGVFYLDNLTFQDLDSQVGYYVYIGLNTGYSPSSSYIASDGTGAVILGNAQSNGLPFVATYTPSHGLKDISSLFPATVELDSVTWNGGDFVITGGMSNGSSPLILMYNFTTMQLSQVSTGNYGDIGLIDTAILVNNSVLFSTFNSKPVPNTDYYMDYSYFGEIKLNPVGRLSFELNVQSMVGVDNETYYLKNAVIPEFSGNYSIQISSSGYENRSVSIYVPPFQTVLLNVTLLREYDVTFTESGLPSGSVWYVTLNGTSINSTTANITFEEPNGSYSFAVLPPSGLIVSPSSGILMVHGSDVKETVIFSSSIPKVYSVTFTESGLASGTTWSVLLNGTLLSSSNNTIEFTESNGSYAYTIQSMSGYKTTIYSGKVTISGNPVNENIVWSVILYPLTMTLTGISNGTSWSVTLTGRAFNGQSVNVTLFSINSTITFDEPNGTYSYVIRLPSGYTSSNSKGTLNVSGVLVTSLIAARQINATSSNTTNYLMYGITAVAIIIAVAGAIFAMRRKKS